MSSAEDLVLVRELIAAARVSLPSEMIRDVEDLVSYAEIDVAICQILGAATVGRFWVVPVGLLPAVERWGARKTRPVYRRAAAQALQQSMALTAA